MKMFEVFCVFFLFVLVFLSKTLWLMPTVATQGIVMLGAEEEDVCA